jgi:hypothetical protein
MELRALSELLGRLRLELEPHDGLIADDPRVVTGLDHVRVAWTDLLLGAIVMGDVHRARLHNADVPHLTALASDCSHSTGSAIAAPLARRRRESAARLDTVSDRTGGGSNSAEIAAASSPLVRASQSPWGSGARQARTPPAPQQPPRVCARVYVERWSLHAGSSFERQFVSAAGLKGFASRAQCWVNLEAHSRRRQAGGPPKQVSAVGPVLRAACRTTALPAHAYE